MGNQKKIVRGLQDLRTLSGRIDQTSSPYRGYMKVSCLEMEKFRRGKEKESALERVARIEARFREIDAEKGLLLQELNDEAGGRAAPSAPRKASPARGAGFKIRY